MKTRLGLSGLLAAILAVAAFVPALAVPPDRVPISLDEDWPAIDCGDFELYRHILVEGMVTTFYDKDDVRTLEKAYVSILWTLTNSKDDRVLTNKTNYVRTSDYEEGLHTYVGVLWHLTVPGRGVVVLDAGRIIVDYYPPPIAPGYDVVWQAGHHELINADDWTVLCQAFE
jgi:hypothetical protein